MGQRMTNHRRVFVVDGDVAIWKSVTKAAASEGLLAETFTTAEQFLGSYEASWSGCLVADVRLFGTTGAELKDRLDAHGVSLPVIALAENASVPLAINVMRAGAVTFLEKPYLDAELCANIRLALDIDAKNRRE